MKAPTTIRTAAVLEAFDVDQPRRLREVADRLGVPAASLTGHIQYLHHVGKIRRLARGQYLRAPWTMEGAA